MFTIKKAEYLKSSPSLALCPNLGYPEIAMIGRSNVGKSSLINMLCERKKLAYTSNTPGKTRLINYYNINDELLIADLPGYGYAKRSKTERDMWDENLSEYLLGRQTLNLILILIDSRIPPQEADLLMLQWLESHHLNYEIIFTKIDKLKSKDLTKNINLWKKQFQELHPILTSSEKRTGRNEVWGIINEATNELNQNL